MVIEAFLALLALTVGLGILISFGLAKAITAWQDRQEATQAKLSREKEWLARRSAKWSAL